MNYTLTFKRAEVLECTVAEIVAVTDVLPLVDTLDGGRSNERVWDVIRQLIAHPMVLFVGDTAVYDSVVTEWLDGREPIWYVIADSQADFMVTHEIKQMCTFVSDGFKYMVVRSLRRDEKAEYVRLTYCFIREDELHLDALIRKYYIDTFLKENS